MFFFSDRINQSDEPFIKNLNNLVLVGLSRRIFCPRSFVQSSLRSVCKVKNLRQNILPDRPRTRLLRGFHSPSIFSFLDDPNHANSLNALFISDYFLYYIKSLLFYLFFQWRCIWYFVLSSDKIDGNTCSFLSCENYWKRPPEVCDGFLFFMHQVLALRFS